jgi:hypothetical protein
MAYICLNVFYLKPEKYDPAFCKTHNMKTKPQPLSPEEEEIDYRRTSAYRKMLYRCTGERDFDTYAYPHREFFGVSHGMYRNCWPYDECLFGLTSLARMRYWLKYGGEYFRAQSDILTYAPARVDIPIVITYLGQKGLPAELSLRVLELMENVPHRRLVVADDPLHVENREELRRYLNYCWQLLVRSDLLANSCRMHINWVNEVSQCLWGVKYPKMMEREWLDWGEEDDVDIDGECKPIRFV